MPAGAVTIRLNCGVGRYAAGGDDSVLVPVSRMDERKRNECGCAQGDSVVIHSSSPFAYSVFQ
jgi:hypothetical protein